MRFLNSKKSVSLPVCIVSVVLAVVVTAICCFSIFDLQTGWMSSATKTKLAQIQGLLSKQGVYGQNQAALPDALAKACVDAINDPYAQYFTKEEYEEFIRSSRGEYTGIGLNVVQHPQNGTVYIYLVHNSSPAALAGLQPGDEIIAVNDATIANDGYSKVVNSLLGKLGDTLNITYLRNTVQYTAQVEIKEFKSQSVFYQKIQEYGYIRITSFNSGTPEQFSGAIGELRLQGVQGLIFDLRDNGGGTLESVEEMLDHILPYGDIVSVRYANGEEELLYVSDEKEIDLPMALLVNGYTASASELFAAAVRDFDKGVLIGSTTYGKGVMQQTVKLFDGSALKYTNAIFYPPSKEGFNGKGLQPDIPIELTQTQQENRYITPIEQDPHVQAALAYLSAA